MQALSLPLLPPRAAREEEEAGACVVVVGLDRRELAKCSAAVTSYAAFLPSFSFLLAIGDCRRITTMLVCLHIRENCPLENICDIGFLIRS